MKTSSCMKLGVGLFVWTIALAVVTNALQEPPVPLGREWTSALPDGALSKAQAAALSRAPGKVRRVMVSIPERKLALIADGRVVKVYRVAVGARVSPSPRGEFRIAVRIPQATYYHAGVVIPAGEQSPIGTRWIGLDQPGYGIHGTNAPGSIGKAASHGCIRLRNRDAEELFELVRVGDVVEIRDEEVTKLVSANDDRGSVGE